MTDTQIEWLRKQVARHEAIAGNAYKRYKADHDKKASYWAGRSAAYKVVRVELSRMPSAEELKGELEKEANSGDRVDVGESD